MRKGELFTGAGLAIALLFLGAGVPMLLAGWNPWLVTGIGTALYIVTWTIRKALAVSKSNQPEKPEHGPVGIGIVNGEDISISGNDIDVDGSAVHASDSKRVEILGNRIRRLGEQPGKPD